MKPEDFVKTYYPYAKAVEQDTGIFAAVILTRAAIESAWSEKAVGNNFMGIKDTNGINGDEQLITTHEFLHTSKAIFPVILKIIPMPNGIYKYLVKDWFRKYNSPGESFSDFANFLKNNARYSDALTKKNALEMGVEICNAGYAANPSSVTLTTQVNNRIENIIKTM